MRQGHTCKCATINAAALLGTENQIGTIEANKSADIIAVKGDPLTNISLLKKMGFVMKEGKVYLGNWLRVRCYDSIDLNP